MAKCGCSGSTCGCAIQGSGSVSVAGTGTAQDPYIVSLGTLSINGTVTVNDGTNIDMSILGTGTVLDPYIISAAILVGATVTVTPATGGTTVVDSGTRTEFLNHGSTIATHTLTLPTSTTALDAEVKILATSAVTALTVSGAAGVTVAGMPTTLAANGFFRAQLIGTVWHRIG